MINPNDAEGYVITNKFLRQKALFVGILIILPMNTSQLMLVLTHSVVPFGVIA